MFIIKIKYLKNNKSMSKKFAGDKKVGESILSKTENKLKFWAVPKIPKFIETYHLTLTTII